MIKRRGALVAIAAAAFGGVDWLISRSYLPSQLSVAHISLSAFAAERVNTVDDAMRADLARLGGHAYSEEGIPMFLACENLAASQTSPDRALLPSALNKKVASAFHRYAAEWQRIHPEAPATDVAKIVELLADRDFAEGGTERSL